MDVDIKVPVAAIMRWPHGAYLVGTGITEDMDGQATACVMLSWRDKHHVNRLAYFAVETGFYMGEAGVL